MENEESLTLSSVCFDRCDEELTELKQQLINLHTDSPLINDSSSNEDFYAISYSWYSEANTEGFDSNPIPLTNSDLFCGKDEERKVRDQLVEGVDFVLVPLGAVANFSESCGQDESFVLLPKSSLPSTTTFMDDLKELVSEKQEELSQKNDSVIEIDDDMFFEKIRLSNHLSNISNNKPEFNEMVDLVGGEPSIDPLWPRHHSVIERIAHLIASHNKHYFENDENDNSLENLTQDHSIHNNEVFESDSTIENEPVEPVEPDIGYTENENEDLDEDQLIDSEDAFDVFFQSSAGLIAVSVHPKEHYQHFIDRLFIFSQRQNFSEGKETPAKTAMKIMMKKFHDPDILFDEMPTSYCAKKIGEIDEIDEASLFKLEFE